MHRVSAPGRVNLIGDHVDYTGGLVMPMAIDMRTVIDFTPAETVTLRSNDAEGTVTFSPGRPYDPSLEPSWGRYVAAVASLMDAPRGFDGRVSTNLPVGAGLSSSAALEIAAALALGFDGGAKDLALLCQRAEHLATGVPTGIMDQLSIASAREGHATMIDCTDLSVAHVPIPDDAAILVRFVAHRTLVGSAYADRVAECRAAESEIGPLRSAALDDVARLSNDVIRARAHHVVTENERVIAFAAAVTSGDLTTAGRLMSESHRSLSHEYQVSTTQMDAAVADLTATPGVFGARMTGGGFGGCIVALCRKNVEGAGWR
ncbi:MAG: galactokinase, partial [Actinomycetota bacterium]